MKGKRKEIIKYLYFCVKSRQKGTTCPAGAIISELQITAKCLLICIFVSLLCYIYPFQVFANSTVKGLSSQKEITMYSKKQTVYTHHRILNTTQNLYLVEQSLLDQELEIKFTTLKSTLIKHFDQANFTLAKNKFFLLEQISIKGFWQCWAEYFTSIQVLLGFNILQSVLITGQQPELIYRAAQGNQAN